MKMIGAIVPKLPGSDEALLTQNHPRPEYVPEPQGPRNEPKTKPWPGQVRPSLRLPDGRVARLRSQAATEASSDSTSQCREFTACPGVQAHVVVDREGRGRCAADGRFIGLGHGRAVKRGPVHRGRFEDGFFAVEGRAGARLGLGLRLRLRLRF